MVHPLRFRQRKDLLQCKRRCVHRDRRDVRYASPEFIAISRRVVGKVSSAKLCNRDVLSRSVSRREVIPLLKVRWPQRLQRCRMAAAGRCHPLPFCHSALIQPEDARHNPVQLFRNLDRPLPPPIVALCHGVHQRQPRLERRLHRFCCPAHAHAAGLERNILHLQAKLLQRLFHFLCVFFLRAEFLRQLLLRQTLSHVLVCSRQFRSYQRHRHFHRLIRIDFPDPLRRRVFCSRASR